MALKTCYIIIAQLFEQLSRFSRNEIAHNFPGFRMSVLIENANGVRGCLDLRQSLSGEDNPIDLWRARATFDLIDDHNDVKRAPTSTQERVSISTNFHSSFTTIDSRY